MPDYFSHDYGARNDPKLIKLRMAMGQEGKGIFWDLIEMMYEQSGYLLHSQYDCYADALHVQPEKIKRVIEDFNLFESDKIGFWNESCRRRLQIRESKSNTARNSANKRWLCKGNTNAMPMHVGIDAIKDIKERKGKKVNIYTPEFEKFYEAYPKKESKATAQVSWNKQNPVLDEVLKALSWQCKQEQWIKEKGQFIPMPATYLNQRRWEDQPTDTKSTDDNSFFPTGCWRPPKNAKI